MTLDTQFRIAPRKESVKAGKGQREVIVEHRLGKTRGAYTADELFQLLGYEEELSQEMDWASKLFRSKEQRQKRVKKAHKQLKQEVTGLVSRYRSHLVRHYSDQGLIPIFRTVPNDNGDRVLYIQAFVDENEVLMLGNPLDYGEAIKVDFATSKPGYDNHRRAALRATNLLKLGGLNPDLKAFLTNIVNDIKAIECKKKKK